MNDRPDLSAFPGATPISGYPGMFATPDGRIISTRRGRARVRATYPVRGHLMINVRRNGMAYPVAVARLVALAFRGEPPTPAHRAIHENGNRTDNHESNIVWATPAEKIAGQIRRGTQVRGERHPQHRLTEDQVREIKGMSTAGHSERYIAERYGVVPGTIGFIVRGKTWTHVGREQEQSPEVAAGATVQGTCPPGERRCETFSG